MAKEFEVALVDPRTHNTPFAEQLAIARKYADAGIRIWLTDQTLNWWPDGLLEDSEVGKQWRHAFWDRYAQIGYLAAQVPEAKWAVGLDVVRRGPDVLAQTMLTTHEITGGRTLFALAAGEAKQSAPYGYDAAKPFTRLEESVRVIRQLWAADRPFSFAGDALHIRNAVQTLRAGDGSTPPLSTIGYAPRLRRTAAEHCEYGMVWGTQDEVREQIRLYREEAEKIGRDPATLKFWGAASRSKFMSGRWFTYEDPAEIEQLKRSPMCKFSALGGWIPSPNSPFGENYHYARDLIPTEWSRERVMAVLDSIPDDEVPWVFFSQEDIADWIVASVEVGIDMVRFADHTAEIVTSRLATTPDFWIGATRRARERLDAA